MNALDQWSLPSATPAARRSLLLYGSSVELWWLPERATRPRASATLLLADRATRIVDEEALWRSDEPPAALTPNRYPFAKSAAILWNGRPEREASESLLDLAFSLVEAAGGSALMNTLGAAATQPRAHIHLVAERLTFLDSLPTVPVRPENLGDGDWSAVEFVRLGAPFPGLVLGVRGERPARAKAAARLLALRVSPAANLVSVGATTWFVPRRCETPAPHFPLPLGCAELWGRFCYEDEAAFAKADAKALDAALAMATWPAQSL